MSAHSPDCSIGLIGLAVMGQNLALNIGRRGHRIAVYNRAEDKDPTFIAERVGDAAVVDTQTLEEFVSRLERPRKIILLVRAGAPVDLTIEPLLPLLEPGDMIIDGGNSHPDDTERRSQDLTAKGFRFVGMGVSGGEEGALNGPSLMPGGPADAYEELRPLLQEIAAQVEDGACVTHVGAGAAGHFLKMVHNGIEYGDMQLIAETYDLMRHLLGMEPAAMGEVFAEWNQGPLESFLIEITADILGQSDQDSGKPMVDVIVDKAGQKGTGRWTCEQALAYGVPIPTIGAAVTARGLSSMRDQRQRAATELRGPTDQPRLGHELLPALHNALYAAKICSYAQGLDLLATVEREKSWGLDFGEIARIWKGGCIIRARFLVSIQDAYAREPELPNLLLDEKFRRVLHDGQAAWRQVVSLAAARGVPVPALGGSLAYFDSYRRARLPQDLTQAQRDYFGAHTFERVDQPSGQWFHRQWT